MDINNNFLRVALIQLLLAGLGRQIGFHRQPIDYSNQVVFNRLLLLLRSGMTMWLIRNLVCPRGDPLPERTFRIRRRMVLNRFLSFGAPNSSFSLGMEIDYGQSFPIMGIEVLDYEGTEVALQLSTVSDIGSKRGRDMVDQMILRIDAKSSKLLSDEPRRVPPKSCSMSASWGPYIAYGDVINGTLRIVYNDRSTSTTRTVSIGNAHSSSITAFTFHHFLPILATCNTRSLKMWYIPSKLANIPVLITVINMPPGRMVFSMKFHPKYPLIFIGRDDGKLQMCNLMDLLNRM